MRISYIKDFKRGDKIKYIFPKPRIQGRNFIFGTVHRVGRSFLEIRSEDKLSLNLRQEHLHNIDYVERDIELKAN